MGYLGDGAQDLVLDFSMRHYRGGAAPRHWHRNGELINPGNPDKDLVEKAARKIAKYRELYREHHRKLHFLPPSPAPLGESTTSCCDCFSYTRAGRRRASSRLLTMGMRNHTHLRLLTAALLSLTLSRALGRLFLQLLPLVSNKHLISLSLFLKMHLYPHPS